MCGVGVRSTIRWLALSLESIVTCTARKAGADTVRGVSVPPARIENDAGTRALTEPPPEDRLRPDGDAPPVGRVVPDAGPWVDAELAEEPADDVGVPDAVAVPDALVDAVLEVELVAVAAAVLVALDELEPPQAASSEMTGRRATTRSL